MGTSSHPTQNAGVTVLTYAELLPIHSRVMLYRKSNPRVTNVWHDWLHFEQFFSDVLCLWLMMRVSVGWSSSFWGAWINLLCEFGHFYGLGTRNRVQKEAVRVNIIQVLCTWCSFSFLCSVEFRDCSSSIFELTELISMSLLQEESQEAFRDFILAEGASQGSWDFLQGFYNPVFKCKRGF